jgi:putative endonuclease
VTSEGVEKLLDARQELGRRGEELAAALIESSGWWVAERNYNLGGGEVDIVAERGDEIIFVEVRTVATRYLATPAVTVNWRKQQFVVRGARRYILERGRENRHVRFDIVAVSFRGDEATLEWFEDAFRPAPSGQHHNYQW